jgi:hypothetical protein
MPTHGPVSPSSSPIYLANALNLFLLEVETMHGMPMSSVAPRERGGVSRVGTVAGNGVIPAVTGVGTKPFAVDASDRNDGVDLLNILSTGGELDFVMVSADPFRVNSTCTSFVSDEVSPAFSPFVVTLTFSLPFSDLTVVLFGVTVAVVALESCGRGFLSGEGAFFATVAVFRGMAMDVVGLTDPVEDRRFNAASFFSGGCGGKGGGGGDGSGLLAAGLGEGAAAREVAVLTLTLETVDATDARLDREDA